jgi:pimeloyl-ACP methyl ester carboxylesterase
LNIRRGYVDTRYGQIHYRESGQGSPLLLLHASPRSSRSYRYLFPFLSKQVRVLAVDTLGFGGSDPLPPDVTMEMLAESVGDLIEALDISQLAVFGLHTGNKIGAALAANRSDLVSHFICCGMTHSILIDGAARNAAIRDVVGDLLAPDDPNAGNAKALRVWARTFATVARAWWSQRITGTAPFTPHDMSASRDEILDYIEAFLSMDAIYRANFAFDLADALRRRARRHS